jgi:excisionase family DNA binding protein
MAVFRESQPVDKCRRRKRTATSLRSVVLITSAEAAEILGVSVQWVYQLASDGELTRHAPPHVRRAFDHAEVEARSLARLSRPRPPRHSYWASAEEAAIELGITAAAVRRMMLEDRLPYVTARNGRRYIRRHQLDVIANVRESRAQEIATTKG